MEKTKYIGFLYTLNSRIPLKLLLVDTSVTKLHTKLFNSIFKRSKSFTDIISFVIESEKTKTSVTLHIHFLNEFNEQN